MPTKKKTAAASGDAPDPQLVANLRGYGIPQARRLLRQCSTRAEVTAILAAEEAGLNRRSVRVLAAEILAAPTETEAETDEP